MGKRFYVVLLSALIVSLLLLGFSFSKESGNGDIAILSGNETDAYIAHFSNDGELDTEKNSHIDISIVNKNKKETSYYLYLNEIDKKILKDVYYSVNGGKEQRIENGIIYLGNLKEYGTEGDFSLFQISLKSENNYRFKLDVQVIDASFLSAKIMNSENVFASSTTSARYYGEKVNNYVLFEGETYRILGMSRDHIQFISEAVYLESYSEDKNYLSKEDYLASFRGKKISEEELGHYKSWLNDGKDFWLSTDSKENFYYVSEGHYLETPYFFSNYYVREVLEVDKNLVVTGGDGTQNNPYEVTYGS